MLLGDKSWWEHKVRLGVKYPVFKPSGKINANEFNLFTGWKVSGHRQVIAACSSSPAASHL